MKTAETLMKGLPMDACDAARLVLECTEMLGDVLGDRREMMQRIRRVMQEGVRAVQMAERTEVFSVVAWASVEARKDRRPATRRDLRCFVRRMLRVKGFAEMPLRKMTGDDCRRLLSSAFSASPSSYKKGRAILHSIFAYGMRREWCDTNPVDRIETPVIHERPIVPLTPEEIARLEAAVRRPEHADMRFSLRLMLYSGLRPAEVKRLQASDIHWEAKEVIIRPSVSKTGGGRIVPLRNAPPRQNAHIPHNWETRWRELRRAAGFTAWRADVCRHTFASYHAAHFRDLPTLQCEMGHSNQHLLHTRYISPISPRRARNYFYNSD